MVACYSCSQVKFTRVCHVFMVIKGFKVIANLNYFFCEVGTRGGNAGRPAPHKARTPRAGPSRPAHFMRAAYSGPPRIYVGPRRGPARFFYFLFIIFFL